MFKERNDWKFVLLIIVFVFVVFFPVVFKGEVLFFGDNLSLRVPNAIYAASRLSQGQLPLWNPYTFAGMPFFADLSTTVMNPFMLFFLIFGPLRALSIVTIINVFLAGVFSYFLGRTLKMSKMASILVAVVFMFSATVMHYTTYLNLLMSSVWLPLSLASLHRALEKGSSRWLVLASVSVAMQILGGHPQPVFYSVLFMVSYALFIANKRSIKRNIFLPVCVVVLALGLTSVVVFPAFELTKNSTRTEIDFEQATLDSLHPMLFVRFLVPNFFDNPKVGMTWGPAWRKVADNTGYGGVVVLVLIILALKPLFSNKRSTERKIFIFFLGAAAVSLILALGKYTPIYRALYFLIPVFRAFRGPAEPLLIFNFSLAVLAGIGLDSFRRGFIQESIRRRISLVTSLVGTAFLVLLLITNIRFDILWRSVSEFHTLARDQVIARLVFSNLVIVAGLVLVTVYAARQKLLWLVVIIAFLDLALFNSRYIFTIPRELISLRSDTANKLHEIMSSQDRFVSYQDIDQFTGLGNYWENMSIQPPFADSFYTEEERKTAEVLNKRIGDMALNWNIVHGLSSPNGYASFLLEDYKEFVGEEGSRQLNLVDFQRISEKRLDELAIRYLLNREGIEQRESALPRARIVGEGGNLMGVGEVVVDDPERVVVKVVSKEPASLVLADSYYPGWEVLIDGREERIEKFENVFRSVQISPGEHMVEFRFRPKALYYGGLVSLVTLGVVAFMFKSNKMFV